MIFSNRKEVLSLKEFMSRAATSIPKKRPLRPVYSFLPPIAIKSLFPIGIDPTFTLFIVGCSFLVVVAISETLLAKYGYTEISNIISSTFKFTLPALGFGTIFYFITTL